MAVDGWADDLAERIGSGCADLGVDEGIHEIAGLYTVLLPENLRSGTGAFYTPPALARRLVELADEADIDWATARVLDPAAGGGALLLPVLRRMLGAVERGGEERFLATVAHRLRGFEIDAHAAWLGQAGLEIVLGEIAYRTHARVPQLIIVADTLEQEPRAEFDLVIGNPPYGRVALSPERRSRYRRSLYGHANLYGIFTDAAVDWARPGGLIAFLTPTSMLGGQYYSALRRFLAGQAPPLALDFVQARRGIFEDVLQETLLALYRRGGRPQRVQVRYLNVSSESAAQVVRNGTIALPQDAAAPWMAPREPRHAALIRQAEEMPTRLADWGYEVCTGPLVWNRFKSQLRDRSGPDIVPLIWAEAVTSDGRFIHRADRRGHSPYFKLERGDEWLRVLEPCVLVQRTTAKEQARRVIAAEMPAAFLRKHGGAAIENHLNMIRPVGAAQVSPAVLAALFNSRVVDELFRCISGSVAVSAFELAALPLPRADQLGTLTDLVARDAGPDAIDAECNRLYGHALE
jgi:adenine-specific DNA-methyltransferase